MLTIQLSDSTSLAQKQSSIARDSSLSVFKEPPDRSCLHIKLVQHHLKSLLKD